ncbi:MAG: precorrin-3B synthase [Janthinobacterium lividum]
MLRIVAARDGGICRVRLSGGELSAAQARAIGAASERFASGVLELTNRSNLQLRGVDAAHYAALPAALRAAGLGAATPGADEVRNVMLSPAAGIDRGAWLDTRALGRAVLTRLEQGFAASGDGPSAFSSGLSPKFSVQIDGGETLAMTGHHHDIWLSAMAPDGAWLGIGLAGSPPLRPDDLPALAAVSVAQAPDLVVALIRLFLERRHPDETRMRHLLLRYPAATLLADAQARAAPTLTLRRDPAIARARRAPADPAARFGAVPQRATPDDPLARRRHVGAQAPLGRLDATQLRALAALAERHGDGTLRLTPWQGVLLPNVDGAAATLAAVTAGLRHAGLIDDADAPLGALLACAGAPGCAKGRADTKADAHRLAAHLRQPVEVHLSGCERGCAAGHIAHYTLVAVPGGRYDLYDARQAADPPGDRPAAPATPTAPIAFPTHAAARDVPARRFGQRVAADLTLDEAGRRIAAAAASPNAFHPTAHA